MNSDSKIQVSVGCTEYLVKEVETLRRSNELLGAQMNVVDNFFSMVNRLGDTGKVGYGTDQLWQAKKEIEAATAKARAEEPKVSNP